MLKYNGCVKILNRQKKIIANEKCHIDIKNGNLIVTFLGDIEKYSISRSATEIYQLTILFNNQLAISNFIIKEVDLHIERGGDSIIYSTEITFSELD